MDVINANPKLAGIDLDLILTPASELRPGAAQRCIMAQACPPSSLNLFLLLAPCCAVPVEGALPCPCMRDQHSNTTC